MADYVDFPLTALRIRDPAIAPFVSSQPGQQATNGMQRSVGVTGVRFKLSFDVFVYDRDSVRTMRAFLAQMEGDTRLVRLQMPDLYAMDGPMALDTVASREAWPLGIPFATDVLFDTDVGHAVPTLDAFLAADASLNDRNIYATDAVELSAGCAVSINDFCYTIAGVWPDPLGQKLRISPVLRKAASAGDAISLAPVFVGHCITDTPGYEKLSMGIYGTHTLEFIEDLTRLVEDID